MTSNRKRMISWIVLIVFSFVIFSSSCFIITHADHSCTGEECSVCSELAQCSETIYTLGTLIAAVIPFLMLIYVVCSVAEAIISLDNKHTTLISLKVELLN